MEHEGMRLEDFIIAIKKRWIMILLIVAIPTILVAFLPKGTEKVEYKASGDIYVLRNDLENVASSPKGSIEYNLLNSFAQFITSDNVIEEAIKNSNTDLTVDTIRGGLDSSIVKDSNIISISLKGEQEEEVEEQLNNIIKVALVKVEEIIPNSTAKLIDKVSISESFSGGFNNSKLIILAFIGMSGLAVLFAFTLEYLDDSFKYSEAVEDILNTTVLASVTKRKNNENDDIEYQKVASTLILNKNEKNKIILFTSSVKNEDKVIAITNIANNLVKFGKKVVVLNVDKDEQEISGSFDIINALENNSNKEYIPYEILNNNIDGIREKYDYVIINGTALNSGVISQTVAQCADAIILVVKGYSTSKNVVMRSMKELRSINTNIIGVILNNINA